MASHMKYYVLEKLPQKSNMNDPIILGPYLFFDQAEEARIKYGFVSENFYVKEMEKERYQC